MPVDAQRHNLADQQSTASDHHRTPSVISSHQACWMRASTASMYCLGSGISASTGRSGLLALASLAYAAE